MSKILGIFLGFMIGIAILFGISFSGYLFVGKNYATTDMIYDKSNVYFPAHEWIFDYWNKTKEANGGVPQKYTACYTMNCYFTENIYLNRGQKNCDNLQMDFAGDYYIINSEPFQKRLQGVTYDKDSSKRTCDNKWYNTIVISDPTRDNCYFTKEELLNYKKAVVSKNKELMLLICSNTTALIGTPYYPLGQIIKFTEEGYVI